ncbi:MAG: glycosyl transferase [Ignavibacteriales bacterium]|nr:MAG: glycosyl transferase [Ignavibacteriales bacterium]
MMYNFCTLFDSNYLSRGIACYRSLEKHCDDFHLYIFAFDDKSYSVLQKMNLPKATIITLKQFEDPELLKVKPTRTIAEYCWTSTSSTILYVLENFDVDNCTYIDADIYFYSSPKMIFDEMGDRSILITEHRYSPQYNKELKAGKYCVQFVTFKKDERGLKALRWWRDRCIEWCYNRFEDGKFGDQLYLDDWTTRFEGVHVLQHNGGGIAAWNVQQYDFRRNGERITGIQNDGKQFDVIFYHFHYLRFYKDGSLELGRRILTEKVLDTFYKPYVKLLDEIKKEIEVIDNSFDSNGPSAKPLNWKTPLLYIYRKLRGTYNIFDKKTFAGT